MNATRGHLYFDIVGGISGDMTVAALLDLGASFKFLTESLKRINIDGYRIKKSSVERGHCRACKFDVLVARNKNHSYRQILRLLKASRLPGKVLEKVLRVYEVLKSAEVHAHGHDHEDISFEQLGDIDSIVDIVSTCLCLESLQAQKISYSLIPVSNKIAPATYHLLTGKRICFQDWNYENVTPTGMAILCALGRQRNDPMASACTVGRVGYGAGSLDSSQAPNVLRVVELVDAAGFRHEDIFVIETNIDDMNPQFFDIVFARLLSLGALDVFVGTVLMKKTRPGFVLTALAHSDHFDAVCQALLKETSTIGLRYYRAQRICLRRRRRSVEIGGASVGVKEALFEDGTAKWSPEYEDCKALALKRHVPLAKIYQEVADKVKTWHYRD